MGRRSLGKLANRSLGVKWRGRSRGPEGFASSGAAFQTVWWAESGKIPWPVRDVTHCSDMGPAARRQSPQDLPVRMGPKGFELPPVAPLLP